MGFHAITPAAPLDRLVERIWDCDMPVAQHRLERILPRPGASLIINLDEDQTRLYADDAQRACSRFSGSVCSGPYSHSFLIDTAEQQRVMGVEFRPGGALPFLREPMQRLGDRDVDLQDIAGSASLGLRQRLLETPAPARRMALLEAWLRTRAPEPRTHPVVRRALMLLHGQPCTARIGEVVRTCEVSPRRFGMLFREHVGLGPKRYARLLRFRQVIDAAHPAAEIDWAGLAADCGFHDQPHLVREFRAFCGMTPTEYADRRGPYLNHVPLEPMP